MSEKPSSAQSCSSMVNAFQALIQILQQLIATANGHVALKYVVAKKLVLIPPGIKKKVWICRAHSDKPSIGFLAQTGDQSLSFKPVHDPTCESGLHVNAAGEFTNSGPLLVQPRSPAESLNGPCAPTIGQQSPHDSGTFRREHIGWPACMNKKIRTTLDVYQQTLRLQMRVAGKIDPAHAIFCAQLCSYFAHVRYCHNWNQIRRCRRILLELLYSGGDRCGGPGKFAFDCKRIRTGLYQEPARRFSEFSRNLRHLRAVGFGQQLRKFA